MNWRRDLAVNALRHGRAGAVHAWFSCPGFQLISWYRWSRRLRGGGRWARFASLLCWRRGVAMSGCYLSPMAIIGPELHLPHPTGIVVGEGVQIGTRVTLYQHVTLGRARSYDSAYPVIEDDVVLYAGAVVVGGVTIGAGAIIGANSVVMHNVPPGCVAAGAPARIVRRPA